MVTLGSIASDTFTVSAAVSSDDVIEGAIRGGGAVGCVLGRLSCKVAVEASAEIFLTFLEEFMVVEER